LGPRRAAPAPFLEISAYPGEFRQAHEGEGLSQIRKAMENVLIPHPADIILLDTPLQQDFFTNHSLLSRPKGDSPEERLCFWQAFQSGLFHHVSRLGTPADLQQISYPQLVSRVAAGISILGQFYSELGLEDELLTVTFALTNAQGCTLIEVPENRTEQFRCYIPEISVRRRRTVADLVSGPEAPAYKIIRDICERFNYAADLHPALKQDLNRVLSSHRSGS
jgi:hypothetical protein